MSGFFEKEEVQSMTRKKGVSCRECGLYKTCKSPKMKWSGEGRKKILNIAEAPGETEDKKGIQLVGKAGSRYKHELEDFDIDLYKDCWSINAVNCRPTDKDGYNRKPTPREIEACRPRVWRAIRELEPKLIILLGESAIRSFLADRWPGSLAGKGTKASIVGRWRGWHIPDRDSHCWVVPTYHPSFIERGKTNTAGEVIWLSDLKNAFELLHKPFPYPKRYHEKRAVEILWNDDEVIDRLQAIQRHHTFMAFDYETTGLKPYAEGHEIVCMGICTDPERSIAFMMTEKVASFVRRLLVNRRIKKTAHNLKFEETWSYKILGVEVKNWVWCSLNGAHLFDNRPGITGLKFQSYVQFGCLPYDEHTKNFLRAKDSNAFNRVKEIPQHELLLYCGIDALQNYRLAMRQMTYVDYDVG